MAIFIYIFLKQSKGGSMRIKILSLLTASLFLTQTSFSKTATMAEQSSLLQTKTETEIEFNSVSQNSSTEAITNKENLAGASNLNQMSLEEAIKEKPELFFTQQAEEFIDLINNMSLQNDVAYSIADTPVGDACVSLIDKNQVLGSVGKAIYAQFSQHEEIYANLVAGGALNKDCSKYSKMNVKQKGLVWVLILTVMAHFESTCGVNAHTKGPNGIAYGLYQLHKGSEDKYDGSFTECSKNASLDPALSSKCVLKMLDIQMKNQGGLLFSNKSYWDVLRPNGQAKRADDIQRAIQKSSYCNAKTM